MICDIWIKYPDKIEENETNVEFIVSTMKKAAYTKNGHPSLNYACITMMFRLFSHFSEVKNPNALFVYK